MSWAGEQTESGVMVFTTDGLPSGVPLGTNGQVFGMRGNEPAFFTLTSGIVPQMVTASGISQLILTSSNQPIASGSITPSNNTSKILISTRIEYIKDGGNTARIVDTFVRRGNQLSGPEVCGQSRIRSQGNASFEFGPAVQFGVDSPATTSPVVYYIWASATAGSPKAQRWSIALYETT